MTNRTNVSNVLVIGSGAAGLRAAIAVHEAGSEVVVVGKRLRKDAHCGVVRNEEKLREGLTRLEEIKAASVDVDVRPTSEGYADLAHALDLRASLVAAEASLLGAIERRESRGAHNRSDHPELDPRLKKNFVVTKDGSETLSVSDKPVDEVGDHLKEWAKEDGEVDIAGRLLE